MQNKNGLAYLLLIFATLFWSGNFIVGKAASIYQIPPFSLNFYRWFFAGLILLPFTYKEIINSFDYIKSKMSHFIILGFTSITIFNSIVYYSLYHTQVISGVLMISTIPVWIILISSFLKIEKTNIFQLSGLLISTLGILVIVSDARSEEIAVTLLYLKPLPSTTLIISFTLTPENNFPGLVTVPEATLISEIPLENFLEFKTALAVKSGKSDTLCLTDFN